MTDLESQLRRLRFRSPSAAARERIFVSHEDTRTRRVEKKYLRSFVSSCEHPFLVSTLAALWLTISVLHFTTPEVAPPDGPRISYAEFQQHTRIMKLQIAMLQTEERLLDLDRPNFSAPRHFNRL